MSKLFIQNAKVLVDSEFKDLDILIKDGVISNIDAGLQCEDCRTYDAKGKRIIPGFVDVHTHGAMGTDFNHALFDDYCRINDFYISKGVTKCLATILTDSKDRTLKCIDEFLNYIEKVGENSTSIIGIHLEGPFLSREYRGAHPEEYLMSFNIELIKEYQKRAKGYIKYITVSPELITNTADIGRLNNLGIVVAIGHSGADYETTMNSIEQGVMASTHTFNAMKPIHHHEPSITGAVLESNIYCEIICDGFHLNPAIVRLIIKTKGIEKVLPVTDSISAAGLPDGKYKLGCQDVYVKDSDAKLVENDMRAGSTLTMEKVFINLLDFTGKSIAEISKAMSENPSKLMGIYDKTGEIKIGKFADMVVLNENNHVSATIVNGDLQYVSVSEDR